MKIAHLSHRLAALAVAALLASCGKNNTPPPPRPTAEVSVVTVATERVEQATELPGRINPFREAQVRARATGILLKRLFEEGSTVREGQLLFEIDPQPLQASLASAKAAAGKIEASLKESRARAQRYQELVKINAISRQVYEEALAALGQNEAETRAAQAAVQTAELNLGYAKVTAPISGRIGKAQVTEGALVSATEATQLAVIRQLDPVYFDFTQSSTDILRIRRSLEDGSLQPVNAGAANVALILEDGSAYAHPGKLLFSEVAVDPTTGMIGLRAVMPNPENLLLPGMFARARFIAGINASALIIPLRTVSRGATGAATVLVVNPENKVEARTVEIDRTIGNRVVISKGLKAGERVLVEGSQKAPPGATVNPVPFTPPATNGTPAHPSI